MRRPGLQRTEPLAFAFILPAIPAAGRLRFDRDDGLVEHDQEIEILPGSLDGVFGFSICTRDGRVDRNVRGCRADCSEHGTWPTMSGCEFPVQRQVGSGTDVREPPKQGVIVKVLVWCEVQVGRDLLQCFLVNCLFVTLHETLIVYPPYPARSNGIPLDA